MRATNDLTRSVLEFLRLQGCFVWRQGNISSVKGRTMNGLRGVPDVIGMTRRGKFIGVEIKNKETKDKLSNYQIEFKNLVKEKNGLYFIISEIEDLDFLTKEIKGK